ncbi:NAD(P)-binding protein [Neolentinus lepideus HHB14362 ss-1]|uniref:NAD(P)-binding protein n=1 Tax=Neolentinus lepideus HHB14362 ss-1 TaxID=1314782 RepID=A0A165R4L2_9AGAM|nr:NAD(P)-binding protein [Neolentinus lepideus HHB14362 ss-1]
MASKTSIFLTGATGYLGGSVLQRLLTHPESSSFEITVLVRNAEKAKLLETFGVQTITGSYSDLDKLEVAAASSDVVFAIADCDDVAAATAILKGLKKRHIKMGTVPILIHTAFPLGVLVDNAEGKYATDNLYSDLDIPKIETLAPEQPHRQVDMAIVAAGEEGFVRTHIILPSTIFGIASGPLFDKGICNPHSIEIPCMIQIGWDRRESGMVGPGKNIWPLVDIDDTADLYIILFDRAREDPTVSHSRNGFYFAENGYYTHYDLAKATGQTLVDFQRATSAEPTPFTAEELEKYFAGSAFFGTNSYCKADRSRALGWKPIKTTQDMLDSIKPETMTLIKSGRIADPYKLKTVFGRYRDTY